ncbi:hypothetical protein CDAR_392751 [Caerostris darwini]|uniref:Uncharacterized protein n=1 Tax=Caerostris darwini TaxID=1538125 RepID=A0AAV4SXS9_9ARAC|nr:hypothetical protein CDAR_392751 [Caerostris darwini]
MEESQTSMPLNEANGEIIKNDINMTESSSLSPKNSLPETISDLLIRPASPSSYIDIDYILEIHNDEYLKIYQTERRRLSE